MEHELKTLPNYFKAVLGGTKQFELRKDDREFKLGDTVLLREWDGQNYTGRTCRRNIFYILRDVPEYGLKEGYVILGL